jgi:iron(III) transport system substrate-binding protein
MPHRGVVKSGDPAGMFPEILSSGLSEMVMGNITVTLEYNASLSHLILAKKRRFIMKKHFLVLVLALAFVFSGGAYAAQKEQLADVIKAAEKEGEVLWTSVVYEEEAMVFVNAFQKEYPKVKVTYTRQHGGEAMELLKREVQTGRIAYDVAQIHNDSVNEFIELDAIEKANWADLGVIPALTRYDNRFVGGFELEYCILYNTNLIKPETAPKRWEDLLDPKWKGKIVTDTRPLGFLGLTGVWGPAKVLDFLRKFGENKPIFVRGQTQTTSMMAAGEYALGAPFYLHSYVELAEKQGGPIGFSLLNPLPSEFTHFGILKGAKHPNAGKLLMAWLGTKGFKLMDNINWGRSAPFGGTKKEGLFKGITPAFPPTKQQVPDTDKYILEMTKVMGARK